MANSNPTLWQRISSETPPFWLKVQKICLALAAVVSYLALQKLIPAEITDTVYKVCLGCAGLSQFAVTDIGMVNGAVNNPLSALSDLSTIKSQVGAIHQQVVAPAKPETIDSVIEKVADINAQ